MMYMMSENEMRALANYNHLVAAFLSVASGLLLFAAGLAIQTAQQENAPDTAWTLVKVVAGVCAVVAALLVVGAVLIAIARSDEITRIKNETSQDDAGN